MEVLLVEYSTEILCPRFVLELSLHWFADPINSFLNDLYDSFLMAEA